MYRDASIEARRRHFPDAWRTTAVKSRDDPEHHGQQQGPASSALATDPSQGLASSALAMDPSGGRRRADVREQAPSGYRGRTDESDPVPPGYRGRTDETDPAPSQGPFPREGRGPTQGPFPREVRGPSPEHGSAHRTAEPEPTPQQRPVHLVDFLIDRPVDPSSSSRRVPIGTEEFHMYDEADDDEALQAQESLARAWQALENARRERSEVRRERDTLRAQIIARDEQDMNDLQRRLNDLSTQPADLAEQAQRARRDQDMQAERQAFEDEMQRKYGRAGGGPPPPPPPPDVQTYATAPQGREPTAYLGNQVARVPTLLPPEQGDDRSASIVQFGTWMIGMKRFLTSTCPRAGLLIYGQAKHDLKKANIAMLELEPDQRTSTRVDQLIELAEEQDDVGNALVREQIATKNVEYLARMYALVFEKVPTALHLAVERASDRGSFDGYMELLSLMHTCRCSYDVTSRNDLELIEAKVQNPAHSIKGYAAVTAWYALAEHLQTLNHVSWGRVATGLSKIVARCAVNMNETSKHKMISKLVEKRIDRLSPEEKDVRAVYDTLVAMLPTDWTPTPSKKPNTEPPPAKGACRDFAAGKCARGNQCPWAHAKAPTRPRAAAAVADEQPLPEDPPTANAAKGRGKGANADKREYPCRLFLIGKCAFEKCRFAHDEAKKAEYQRKKASGELAPCKLHQAGKCTYGDDCLFKHKACVGRRVIEGGRPGRDDHRWMVDSGANVFVVPQGDPAIVPGSVGGQVVLQTTSGEAWANTCIITHPLSGQDIEALVSAGSPRVIPACAMTRFERTPEAASAQYRDRAYRVEIVQGVPLLDPNVFEVQDEEVVENEEPEAHHQAGPEEQPYDWCDIMRETVPATPSVAPSPMHPRQLDFEGMAARGPWLTFEQVQAEITARAHKRGQYPGRDLLLDMDHWQERRQRVAAKHRAKRIAKHRACPGRMVRELPAHQPMTDSDRHLLRHRPALPTCETCRDTRSTRAPWLRGKSRVTLEHHARDEACITLDLKTGYPESDRGGATVMGVCRLVRSSDIIVAGSDEDMPYFEDEEEDDIYECKNIIFAGAMPSAEAADCIDFVHAAREHFGIDQKPTVLHTDKEPGVDSKAFGGYAKDTKVRMHYGISDEPTMPAQPDYPDYDSEDLDIDDGDVRYFGPFEGNPGELLRYDRVRNLVQRLTGSCWCTRCPAGGCCEDGTPICSQAQVPDRTPGAPCGIEVWTPQHRSDGDGGWWSNDDDDMCEHCKDGKCTREWWRPRNRSRSPRRGPRRDRSPRGRESRGWSGSAARRSSAPASRPKQVPRPKPVPRARDYPEQQCQALGDADPVYQLRKALYGLKHAGFDAITTLRELLDADPAVISADEDEADLIVAEIEREYALKVQGEAEKFVGLKIRGRRMDPDGTKHVYFGHPDHCEFIATQYEGMIGKLKPSKVPARDDLYHDIHLKERKQPENIKAVQKMIGCALWRGRVDRPDTMNAIAMLASRISTWDDSCDDALACLVGFLRSSKDMCLHFKVAPGEKWANVRLTAYADASLRVPRSITGIVGVVTSTAGTWCPFLSVSRKQPLSTHSAPAAECVALVEAVQLVLPWAPLFSENPVDMCSDSMAAVLGAERGGHIASVAYLYAGKAIQLRFCVIGDLVAQQVITVRHVDGHTNAANQLTKVLGRTLYEVERAFLVELFRCGE